MEQVEELFFKTFNIKPSIKKGETYVDNNCRWVEKVAEKDIYPLIDSNKLLELEDFIGTFTIQREIAPQDCILYQYIKNNIIGKKSLSRKDALLYLLIYNKEYFNDISLLF